MLHGEAVVAVRNHTVFACAANHSIQAFRGVAICEHSFCWATILVSGGSRRLVRTMSRQVIYSRIKRVTDEFAPVANHFCVFGGHDRDRGLQKARNWILFGLRGGLKRTLAPSMDYFPKFFFKEGVTLKVWHIYRLSRYKRIVRVHRLIAIGSQ